MLLGSCWLLVQRLKLLLVMKGNFKNGQQDVMLIAEFDLIDLKKTGPRRSVAPTAKFSEIVLAA